MKNLKTKLNRYFGLQKKIVAVYLFGSKAKGKATKTSDVDLAVLFKPGSCKDSFDESLKISCDAMDLLSVNRVDVVVLNQANPVLKNQIYKYGKVIYCTDPVQALRFKARSFIEYLDIAPLRKIAEVAMRRKALSYGR